MAGKSCHGGSFEWSLPVGSHKGDWQTFAGELKICSSSFHLTKEPFRWYKVGCELYEAEAKDIKEWESDKCVARSVRLIKKVRHPKWWTDTLKWIDTLKDIAWFKPDGKPNKEWKLYPSRNAARNAAWNAAWDAGLYARILICSDLKLDKKHIEHAKKRMQVWQKGYGLYCDVNGVLYVYEKN